MFQEQDDLVAEYWAKLDYIREAYSSTAIDGELDAMDQEGWQGTREQYREELKKREVTSLVEIALQREKTPVFSDPFETDDDIPF